MPSLGPAEILVILVVALLVFGPNKMPEIARQVGKGMREFRRVQQHLRSELRDVVSEFDSPHDGDGAPAPGLDPVPMLPAKDEPPAPAAVADATTDDAPAPALPAADVPPVDTQPAPAAVDHPEDN